MTEWLIALITLTFLEIVLGVDNIIFISILSGKLPKGEQKRARRVGLIGAILASVVVLVVNSFVIGKVRDNLTLMTVPLDAVPYVTVTVILLAVGVVIGAAGSAIGLRRFLRV